MLNHSKIKLVLALILVKHWILKTHFSIALIIGETFITRSIKSMEELSYDFKLNCVLQFKHARIKYY